MLRSTLAPLVALVLPIALLSAAPPPVEDGYTSLFDGRTLEGWEPVGGAPDNWIVDDGRLVCQGKGGGWLSTKKTYGDFSLKLEYQIGPGGNSGVFIRSPRTGDAAYTGMEIQILDDNADQYRELKPFQYAGSLYGVVAAERGHIQPPGHWNTLEITAKGRKVTVAQNSVTVVEADLDAHPEAVEAHPGIQRPDGYIGLQSHSDRVEFRNIRVRELK